ncbi:MAG: 4Fe-4S binding protein [Desulfuromonadales bacterium]|nr:4Fe-4S binding protein [Desulfuromonadales bacterium]
MNNLLDVKFVGQILRSRWSWRLLRLSLLLLLLLIAAAGWHHHTIPGLEVKDPLMYTNLATYGFWVVWMMGVVFIALFFGRAWCSVCPLGWLNGLVARSGFKLTLPRWINNYVSVTIVLVLLQLIVYLFAIHRYPDFTAWLIGLMLLLTVFSGAFFRGRAFCKLFCPAGAVFGLYARIAPFSLRVKDEPTCAGCDTRACVSGGRFWKKISLGRAVGYWHAERDACPVDLFPAELRDDSGCTLCLGCLQNCDRDNMRLGFRPWLAELGKDRLALTEGLFLLVLLGMLTANFSKVNVDLRELIFWLPEQVAQLLGWQAGGYNLLAVLWITLGLPLLLTVPGWLVMRLAETNFSPVPRPDPPTGQQLDVTAGWWQSFRRLALPYIPLLLAAHAILALVKLNAKGGYLPLVLGDPSGVKSYLAINIMTTVTPPGVVVSLDLLKWVVLLLLIAGYAVSLIAAQRVALDRTGAIRWGYFFGAATGVTLVAALYLATIIVWLFIR